MTDKTLFLSFSSRGTLGNCPRKFQFSKLFQHPRRAENFTASVGKAIHVGYQTWLETGDLDKALFALMLAYPVAQNWNFLDERSLEASAFTLINMTETSFSAEFEVARIKTLQGIIMPAIEVPFQINFLNEKGDPIRLVNDMIVAYRGFIDAIMYSSFLDRYRVTDIKTHRDARADQSAKYKFHGQQIPYGVVLEFILGRKLEEFDVSYMSTFIDILSPKVDIYTFRKNKKELQNWLVNLILDLRMLNSYLTLNYFKRTEYGCQAYGSDCHFFQVCENANNETIQKIFLMGQEPAEEMPWEPWVVLDVVLPGEV